jgi:hypothetical protein
MTTSADALRATAAAIDALADALASGSPDRVLAAEEPLAHALQRLTAVRPAAGEDRVGVRQGARAVRLAIGRCERLGRVSADLERVLRGAGVYARPVAAPQTIPSESSRS